MKLFRIAFSRCLKNPMPSPCPQNCVQTSFIQATLFSYSFEENIVHFTTQVENTKPIYMYPRDCDPRYVIITKNPYMM